jgi:sugar (pentulose or hexulose) kinase
MTARTIGVIDIGKSNAKVAVVDLDSRTEIAVRKMPNTVLRDGLYPHFDIDGLWTFICNGLAELNALHPFDALSVTTHGASAVLIDADGALALPMLDYEYLGPDELAAEYDAARPAFSESFTPRLPGGLNVGAQLFWQSRKFPEQFARTTWVLTYPQYWSFRLTGVVAAEITSLGCHTDLWNFETDLYSSLVLKEGWLGRMPEVRPASDVLGVVTPELAAKLGFAKPMPVHSGIHDSNASLLPHILERQPPFAVVSTGTWVIVGVPGGQLAGLDPSRDCLANIDAFGRPVPSSRFMGGREFEMLTSALTPSPAAISKVLQDGIMLLPSVQQGSGPYPHRAATWRPTEPTDEDERYVAASFYLAAMTAECLALAGAAGPTVVEGPFAQNALYLEMLASATGRSVEAMTQSATGTSIGAALLARMDAHGASPATSIGANIAMTAYARKWRAAVG